MGLSVVGRPKILTFDLIEDFTQLVRDGFNPADACAYLDITWQSYKRWMGLGKRRLNACRDKDSDALYIRFYVDVSKAKSEAMRSLFQDIRTASKDGDWRAAAYLIDRFDKQRERKMMESVSEDAIRGMVMRVAKQVVEEMKDECNPVASSTGGVSASTQGAGT